MKKLEFDKSSLLDKVKYLASLAKIEIGIQDAPKEFWKDNDLECVEILTGNDEDGCRLFVSVKKETKYMFNQYLEGLEYYGWWNVPIDKKPFNCYDEIIKSGSLEVCLWKVFSVVLNYRLTNIFSD